MMFALTQKHRIKASMALWAMLAFIFSNSAFALNVGDIRVESYLDQPFKAVVPIVDADANDLHSLKVDIASQRAFQLAGLEYSDLLKTIRIRVDKAKGSVYVFTVQPLNEPLLMLLVDYQWQNGRIVREHTVFLDPEGFNPTGVARVESPTVAAEDPSPTAASQVADFSLPSEYGPVGNGESLSAIATKLAKGTPLSSAQMMMALYDANPAAFYKKNITALKRGATLDIPPANKIQQREAAAMLSIVSDHLKAWSNGQQEVTSQLVAVPESMEVSTEVSAPVSQNEAAFEGDTSIQQTVEPPIESASESENESHTESLESVTELSNVARNNPRLELVPESNISGAEASNSDASTATVNSPGNGSEASIANSQANGRNSSPAAAAATQEPPGLSQLQQENALLRERLEQADSVVKELKHLYTINSEQLAKLNDELVRLNLQSMQTSETVEPAPRSDGWLIWLVIGLLVVLILLLILLLIVLLRRRTETRDFENDDFAAVAPIPAMTVDPDGAVSVDEAPIEAPITDQLVPDYNSDTAGPGYHVEEVDYSKMAALLGDSAEPKAENLGAVGLLDDIAPNLDASAEPNPELLDIDAFLAANTADDADGELEAAEEIIAPENEQSISGEDSLVTNLDLARAYIDMGNADEAKALIQPVLDSDNATLKAEAQQLLTQLS